MPEEAFVDQQRIDAHSLRMNGRPQAHDAAADDQQGYRRLTRRQGRTIGC
jgi:hypothetical protein